MIRVDRVDRQSARVNGLPCPPKNPYFICLKCQGGQGSMGKWEITIPMGNKNKNKSFLFPSEMNVRNRVSLSTSQNDQQLRAKQVDRVIFAPCPPRPIFNK